MLEQEIASIIKFVLDSAGNPTPYYYNIPQSFQVPAAYFPRPEITTGGDTLASYEATYSLYVNFFDRTTEKAYDRAYMAFDAILRRRNLIPLIDTQGNLLRKGVRLKDPSLRATAECVAQLVLEFVSRRPYDVKEAEKMQTFEAVFKQKPYESVYITEAMEKALEEYLEPPTE